MLPPTRHAYLVLLPVRFALTDDSYLRRGGLLPHHFTLTLVCARNFLLKIPWRAASRADGSLGLLTSPTLSDCKA